MGLKEDAVRPMREKAIRRLPVLEDGKAGALCQSGIRPSPQDPRSALGHISAAPANR
jgi:hypothetical protein